MTGAARRHGRESGATIHLRTQFRSVEFIVLESGCIEFAGRVVGRLNPTEYLTIAAAADDAGFHQDRVATPAETLEFYDEAWAKLGKGAAQ